MARHWRRVALAIARKTSRRVGLDTSTRMVADADLQPKAIQEAIRARRFPMSIRWPSL
jgi:hypothetical protein